MHCVSLAELAAAISQYGPAIIASRQPIQSHAVTCYWASSRNRFELWQHTVFRYQQAEREGDMKLMSRWWEDHSPVLEEILVSELLTRVVAAVAAGLEKVTGRDEISPITHAVFCSHLEASNRVQQLMLQGRGNSVQGAVRLNRLRKATERWTDALLGRVSQAQSDCVRYSANREVALEFAEESRSHGLGPHRSVANLLMETSMSEVLRSRTSDTAALPNANRNVADSTLLLFRPELFDDFGTVKSTLLNRIENDHVESERMPQKEKVVTEGYDTPAKSQAGIAFNQSDFERWYI